MQVNFDYKKDQKFIERKTNKLWSLLDITETTSLLHPETGTQILVHLIDRESKRIKRVAYVHFESNFMRVENSMVEQINKLNNILNLEVIPNPDSLQD
jgi:hypothetical protein